MGSEQRPAKVKPFTRAEKSFIHTMAGMLKTESFEKLKVTVLLQQSGYSKGAFYGRFEDKYDFVAQIFQHLLEMVGYWGILATDCKINGESTERLFEVHVSMYEMIYEYRDLFELIFDGKLPGCSDEELTARLDQIYRKHLEGRLGTVKIDYGEGIDDDLCRYMTACNLVNLLKYWRRNQYRFSAAFMARHTMFFSPYYYSSFSVQADK